MVEIHPAGLLLPVGSGAWGSSPRGLGGGALPTAPIRVRGHDPAGVLSAVGVTYSPPEAWTPPPPSGFCKARFRRRGGAGLSAPQGSQGKDLSREPTA